MEGEREERWRGLTKFYYTRITAERKRGWGLRKKKRENVSLLL